MVTVNERIVVLTVGAVAGEAAKRELKVECSHKGKTVSLFLAVQGNQIAVGDLMRSVLLYNYVPSEQRLELAAEEHESTPRSEAALVTRSRNLSSTDTRTSHCRGAHRTCSDLSYGLV